MFERSIELVTLWLRSHTSYIGLVELLYISAKAGLGISVANWFQCFVLTKMFSKNVIMIILENACTKITSGWYIDSVIKIKITIGVHRLSAICRDVLCIN